MRVPDIRHAATVAEAVASDFYADRLDLSARDVVPGSTWSRMPEVECVTRLRVSGASHRTVRLFLTFIAAMDRARDAARLWNNGVELFQSCPELFEPGETSGIPLSTLRERLSQFGVSQRHGPDSSAWHVIARSLAEGGNPVSRVVDCGVGNAGELLRYLRTSAKGQFRFPLLRGPKIGPMWVRMRPLRSRAIRANRPFSVLMGLLIWVAFIASWLGATAELPVDQWWSMVLFIGGFTVFLFLGYRLLGAAFQLLCQLWTGPEER